MHIEIPLSLIDESPTNPRKKFGDAELAELADSIRSHGVLQEVVVRAVGERYELVVGARRLRASRLVGLEAIPAVVRELSDETEYRLIHRNEFGA